MTQLVVVARLRDLSGALERLLGLLRRRALPVDGLSVYRSQDDILEVAVRFGELSTPWDRVEAELNELVDLISVRRLDTDACGEAREFALARTDGEIGPWPEALSGIVRHQADDAIELQEARLRSTGLWILWLARVSWSGRHGAAKFFRPGRAMSLKTPPMEISRDGYR